MRVRILASRATDVRGVQDLAARHGVASTVEILGMGSAEERAHYRALKERHAWRHLPMVFVDDEFVGGEPELAEHLRGMAPPGARIAALARVLGYGGLLPFAALAFAAVAGLRPLGFHPLPLLGGYAATILSFVGAVHWGLVVAEPTSPARNVLLTLSVVPALVAWTALALPVTAGLWLFVAGFVGWYAWERYAAWQRYPDWYRALRTTLTLVVALALSLTALLAP